MSYVPFFSHGDAATEAPDTDDPPVLCVACGCAECDCGEGPLYACDSCSRMVPEDEIRHIRQSHSGETYQCERCLDAAFAEVSGGYRRRGGEG